MERKELNENLITSAENGDLPGVKNALQNGADIKFKSGSNDDMAIHYASRYGYIEMITYLIEYDANIVNVTNKDENSPIMLAAKKGHISAVQFLITNNAYIHHSNVNGWTALHWASLNGHTDIVKLLFDNGANIHVASKSKSTALMLAAQNGHNDIVKYLIQKGANVHTSNEYDWTALHWASWNGHENTVVSLIEHGANVNVFDQRKSSPVMLATQNRHKDIVKYLIEKGADVNTSDEDGWTALHFATMNGYADIAILILDKKANVNCLDKFGNTPLHYASSQGDVSMIELLLLRKANESIKNSKAEFALDLIKVDDENRDIVLQLFQSSKISVLTRINPKVIASFHEHVQTFHLNRDKGFENEYQSLFISSQFSYDEARQPFNKAKNRFANIHSYDFCRVKLLPLEGISGSDYINASFIDGYMKENCYIAAQGPLPNTLSDFWRMIWEHRIENIVMLTKCIEAGRRKCEQYWPEKIEQTLDVGNGLVVLLNSIVPFADYIIHSLKITNVYDLDSEDLIVTHCHFTSWPDHGVPGFTMPFLKFIMQVRNYHDKNKGVPLLVHCSAGVGRTGVFILIDSMIDQLMVEDSINVCEFVRQMRGKRTFMVQTLGQYVFAHDALDELLTCGITSILASTLRAQIILMDKIIPGKNVTGFQEQFQLLQKLSYNPRQDSYSDGIEAVNMPKNRYPDIIPLNMCRARLRPTGIEGSDYINASFIDGHRLRNAYIVTQGPLKNTVEDFWRMIMEFRCHSIVQLCNNVEEVTCTEKCYMYWPIMEGEEIQYGRVNVTLQSETPFGDYIIRKLHISNESKDSNEVVTQFHYTAWPEHGHPTSTGSILELIDMLTKAQRNSGNKPIVVVCNDGIGRSGAFICIHSQLESLKTEGEVDVFSYIKLARIKHTGILSKLDHYIFCHEVLADYVKSFDTYANFKDL